MGDKLGSESGIRVEYGRKWCREFKSNVFKNRSRESESNINSDFASLTLNRSYFVLIF